MLGPGLMREAVQAVLGAYFTSPAAAPVPSLWVYAWQCTLCGVAARAGVFALWGCGPAKYTARDAMIDMRQMILTPEQWYCLNPMEITTPRA